MHFGSWKQTKILTVYVKTKLSKRNIIDSSVDWFDQVPMLKFEDGLPTVRTKNNLELKSKPQNA